MAPRKFGIEFDGATLVDFVKDRSPVSIIQGPFGSGTSTACCFKMWMISCQQKPDAEGVRRTRWLVVRNTFSDLKETTLKTWTYWFEHKAQGAYGEVRMTNPPMHHIQAWLPDRSRVDAEFIFLALDQEEDVRKLLSLEMTGVWFNEMQFTEKAIFDTAHGRAMQGRYPPKMDGGPTWKGVLGDLNAPPEGHWIPYMRGDLPMPDEWDDEKRREYRKPADWKFFMQPPGLIEIIEDGRVVDYDENTLENRQKHGLEPVGAIAENAKWREGSYKSMIAGKDKRWIDTFVMNRVGFYRDGKAVFASFRPEVHVAKRAIEYQPEFPLIVGLDFARNPAMVCCQLIRGALYVLDEFGVENQAATTYAPLFRQRLARKFPVAFTEQSRGVQFWGDPSGDAKGQGTDNTPYQIFHANRLPVVKAPGGNVLSVRLNAVQAQIDKLTPEGPGLMVSPSCLTLKAGLAGGYHYKKKKGTSQHHEEPEKDRYADFADALQYAALGAGLGFAALNPGSDMPKPHKVERKAYSLMRRRRRA